MFRSSLHDSPHPILTVSWHGLALSALLFVIGPIALTVLVSNPSLALGIGLGIGIYATSRLLTPSGRRAGERPCPNGRGL